MTKAILWLTVTIGFGWTALMAIPAASVAVLTLAQGSPATFEVKDWANLGGFGTFAIAMYALYKQQLDVQKKQVDDFRADMKEERAARERHVEIHGKLLSDNTAATRELTVAIGKLKD